MSRTPAQKKALAEVLQKTAQGREVADELVKVDPNALGAIPADEIAADKEAHLVGESIQETDMEPTPEQLAAAKIDDERRDLERRIERRPTVGKTLLYTLSEGDAADIDNLTRAGRCAEHTPVKAGDVYPYVITRAKPGVPYVNGRVLLDGAGDYHAMARQETDFGVGVSEQGKYHWPSRG